MGKIKWSASLYQEPDLSALAQLGSVISGPGSEVDNEAFLRWQYLYNPTGKGIMWLAKSQDTGQLIGSYSVIPIPMKIGEQEMIGSLSLNTMTHPDFQKQGIFTTLAELTYDSCRQAGIGLTIGIPNENSYRGFTNSLKFRDIGHSDMLIKPLRIINILQSRVSNKFVKKILEYSMLEVVLRMASPMVRRSYSSYRSNISIQKITNFDQRFDDLWQRTSNKSFNMVVRKSDHLNWRFFACPIRNYQVHAAFRDGSILGYIVAIISKHPGTNARIAFIVDIIVEETIDKKEIYKELVASIEDWSQVEQVDAIGIYLLEKSVLTGIFRKFGYLKVPDRLRGSAGAFIVRLHLPEHFDHKRVMNISDWYFMGGDNDRP